MKKTLLFVVLLVFKFLFVFGQGADIENAIEGKIFSEEKVVPYASIYIKGTTIGTVSDENGNFQLTDVPAGKHVVCVKVMGYKPTEQVVDFEKGGSARIKFNIQEDVLGIEEVVVTGDRSEKNRNEASIIVSTISPKLFGTSQSVNLAEGLNFCPGLRSENNCGNCGFNQVRMNGLEGPYSQILINNRPIFSGLAGVYGLELIPSNIIDRVEVVRGGGSALYGSNAIAGTINLILKEPVTNQYEFGASTGLVGIGGDIDGDAATDYNFNFNSSVVSKSKKTGMTLYGSYRDKEPFDANDDDFSELSEMKNTTVGARLFQRVGYRSKFTLDFLNIKEERRGGDGFDQLPHETNITEGVEHNITNGALSYEQFFREQDLLSVYVSGQKVARDSYYGANQSLSDYGFTEDFTYTFGAQYNAKLNNLSFTLGAENVTSALKDEKMGYYDIASKSHIPNTVVSNQESNTYGAFVQFDYKWNKFNFSLGARLDNYSISDFEREKEDDYEKAEGSILSPRLTFKYDILKSLQARLSYSQGYRAPQIFDEDLHILTSGSRQVIHNNDPDLEQETSHSYMASLDFNKKILDYNIGFLAEAFYTKLENAFVNEYGEVDENGVVEYTRVNAEDGAVVKGVNFEFNFVPSKKMYISAGWTFQTSRFEEAQEFDEKKFFRTPESYGYIAADFDCFENLCFSISANYTGEMLVPHFYQEIEELNKSNPFFDAGVKLEYDIDFDGSTLRLFGGMKNIFNSYQDDFDKGIDRDPGYIYGPAAPRTIYFGIKFGNLL